MKTAKQWLETLPAGAGGFGITEKEITAIQVMAITEMANEILLLSQQSPNAQLTDAAQLLISAGQKLFADVEGQTRGQTPPKEPVFFGRN